MSYRTLFLVYASFLHGKVSCMKKILQNSWALFARDINILFIGAVILSVLYMFMVSSLSQSMERDLDEVAQGFGLPQERYQEYEERIRNGDSTAEHEMMLEVNALSEYLQGMTEQEREAYALQRAREVADTLAPIYMAFGVLTILLLFLGVLISLVMYTEGHGHIIDASHRCTALFFPMAAVWIWIFVRSFGWVVLLGLIPGLQLFMPFFALISAVALFILGPLLLFAPVLLVQESLSPREAVKQSIIRSKGHWGCIVKPVIIVGILMAALHAISSIGLVAISQQSREGAVFLSGLLQQLTVFFSAAFLIVLLKSLAQKENSQ